MEDNRPKTRKRDPEPVQQSDKKASDNYSSDKHSPASSSGDNDVRFLDVNDLKNRSEGGSGGKKNK